MTISDADMDFGKLFAINENYLLKKVVGTSLAFTCY